MKWSLRLFVVAVLFVSLLPAPLLSPVAIVVAAVLLRRGRPLSLPGPVIGPIAAGAALLAGSQAGHIANNAGQALPSGGLDLANAIGLSLATAWYARTLRVVAREDLQSEQLYKLWTTTMKVSVAVGLVGVLSTLGTASSTGVINLVFGSTAFAYGSLAVSLLWALLTAFAGLSTASVAKAQTV